MGCHTSRTLCTDAHGTAAATGAATQLSTYAGAPLDAVVAYERAALRLSHDLNHLRRSAETTTEIALVRSIASTPTGGNGPATASQPPRRPLLQFCIDVQKALRQQHEPRQHHRHTYEKEVVAVETAYQDGVPVLLQELAWEWCSSAAEERQGKTSNAGRPSALSAEQMAAWKTHTAQLLYAYVSSRRYKKALRRARKAAATGARVLHPAVASAVGRGGEARSDGERGAPEPRVFRTLFKSYAGLGRSLTTSHSAAAGAAARSSSAVNSRSAVTPSMWCAALCQFVSALPEPLMPSLCSRRLEPFAGAPPSRSAAATAPTSTAHATYVEVRRVVSESFISTDVVAYITFCYVLDLVREHRAELTGDEVEAVAKAIVREPSLPQTTREVAHACDPEARMFWPPRTSVAVSSTAAAAAAAMVRGKVPGEDGRRSGNSIKDGSGRKGVAAAGGGETGTHSQLAAAKPAVCAAVEVVVKAPTPSTTPAAAGGGMRRPSTSSSSATGSEEDDSASERHPPAAAACAIPAAAQRTEDMHRAPPVSQQGSSKTGAAAVSHPQPDRKERFIASSEAPFVKGTSSVGENSSSVASVHRRQVAQRSATQLMPPSGDENVQRSSVLASRPDLTALSMSRLNSALYSSALEDPAAVEAEAEDLRCALQRFSDSSLPAAASIRNHDDDGDGIHSRSPSGESGSPQDSSIDDVSTPLAPVPPRPPQLSSPHRVPLTSTSSQRDEPHLLPKCGGAATPTPAVALLPLPLAQRTAAPLPATAFRAQAEQPLLTALMVAKQHFLAAVKMTPARGAAAALSPPQTAEVVGRTAAGGKGCSGSFVDRRLENVMARAREMGWTSPESLIESLKAAQWHSHGKTPAIAEAEAAALPSPHVPAFKPDALSSSSDRHAQPRLPQPRDETPHQARKGAAVSGANSSITECWSGHGPVSQQPHTPHQGADACRAFPSSRTESADSAMRVEATRVLCSGGAAHAGLPSESLLSPPAAESSRVAGTGHAYPPAPLQGHEGLVSSGLTNPLTRLTMPTSATAGAAAAQPLIELEQELVKLRHLVRTLESKQFVHAHQSSAQASELQAQCAELQHQQLAQAKELRLALARLISVGNELEGLRDVKTHLQMQLTASQQESARLRDALLMGETRARDVQ
ncbi:conserved hypothetical protein [Leishmania major strain Friedlin]|uniref:Uncharacterized protein n=1 Tax=Leishmania major TaxID=5664 RepID=Q4QA09_LEIMA|nr:conserved hypothetical protein [Leishmania major strain Friedlin]CAG9575098.1 hypothetical_protein_-_conserved [Leishmania major strain Friedlin]CAJ04994.1 conserved hypothetical protein [Leishmania major strain Friedlin]|eukprot:XP_001683839.1 conserved hypothetical protein [Leishmania major strain Friedlin]